MTSTWKYTGPIFDAHTHIGTIDDISNMIPCRLTGKPFWDIYLYKDPPLWKVFINAVRYFGCDGWLTDCDTDMHGIFRGNPDDDQADDKSGERKSGGGRTRSPPDSLLRGWMQKERGYAEGPIDRPGEVDEPRQSAAFGWKTDEQFRAAQAEGVTA